jgi:hypothetical protein
MVTRCHARPCAVWRIVDGTGQDRRHRLRSPHQPRRRRDCLGPPSALVGLEQLPACTGHRKQHRRAGSTASSDACTEPYLLMTAQTIIARRQPTWCRCELQNVVIIAVDYIASIARRVGEVAPHRLVRHRSTRPTPARCRPLFSNGAASTLPDSRRHYGALI